MNTPTPTRSGAVEVSDQHLPEVASARYQEEGSLGIGGMGEVRLCLDHAMGRHVAMKVPREGLDERSDVRARFLLEARVQGQLEHPSIVPVYDLGRAEGAPFFTMRRVKGRTLEEVLVGLDFGTEDIRERFNERRLLSDFSQLCLALDFVHERGVVHRDLKPANIMFGEYGEVYLLDWGLAKVLGRDEIRPADVDPEHALLQDSAPNTQFGTILGTLGYVAPEVVGSEGSLDGRADIYGLGALLFEIVTGERLHEETKAIKLVNSTLRGVTERVKNVDPRLPPELEKLVLWATALDPAARCPSARDLHDGIERYLDGHRDSERRRQLADTLVAEVADEVDMSTDSEREGARRNALTKLGRALALDPSHGPALERLVALLTEPPPTLPAAVREELAVQETRQTRQAGRMGAGVFLALNLFLPLVIWTGVRSWLPVVLFSAFTTATGVTSWLVSRLERPTTNHALAVYVLALATAASTSAFFGPYVLAPLVIVVVTLLFSLNHPPQYRHLFVVLGALAALLPMGLEWVGAVAPSMSFGADGMRLLPRMSELRRVPTLAILTIASVGVILIAGGAIGPIRRELDRAQARVRVQAWQLRQMVPTSADSVKDGVGGAERTDSEDTQAGEAGE